MKSNGFEDKYASLRPPTGISIINAKQQIIKKMQKTNQTNRLMRRIAALLLFVLVGSMTATANDYLEISRHYSVYVGGADCIHFKIPVWAYGSAYDYYANNAYACYQIDGTGTKYHIFEYESERYGDNSNDDNTRGTVWVKVMPGMGTLVVTSMYDGSRRVLTPENSSGMPRLEVKQIDDDDCPQVTILECDWYPPATLTESTNFTINVAGDIYRSYTGNQAYTFDYHFNGPFSGARNMQSPMLFDPYLYSFTGDLQPGTAAVPYVVYQDVYKYNTSLHPSDTIAMQDRSGSIMVSTSDSVIEDFYTNFEVQRNDVDRAWLQSNSVQIPAYHRIYNLTGVQEEDSMGSLTGNVSIGWNIVNPSATDIMGSDYFEVQRAFQNDWSDAVDVALIPYGSSDSGYFTFRDNSRDAFREGQIEYTEEQSQLTTRMNNVILTDTNGNPVVKADITLHSNKTILPGIPTYYRVRRVSAAAFGWNNDFARQCKIMQNSFLAPLARNQAEYWLDDDFENNQTVHFNVKIENKDIERSLPDISYTSLTYKDKEYLADSAIVDIISYLNSSRGATCTYVAPNGQTKTVLVNTILGHPIWVETGSQIVFQETWLGITNTYTTYIINNSVIRLEKNRFGRLSSSSSNRRDLGIGYSLYLCDRAVIDSVKNVLYNQMRDELGGDTTVGKTIWDNTARLVLVRELVENGDRREFVIPQDSIRRDADGNWYAHFTDVASAVCTHYRYYVRIDQTNSLIHLMDSADLEPVAINGPDLYTNTAASVGSFAATQGSEKRGILLTWEPTTGSVDRYTLGRRLHGSDGPDTTLLSGLDENYWDLDVEPNQQYDYQLSVYFTCNGTTTVSSGTATGWRSPYGSISGSVRYEDGTRCAGVAVKLSTDGQPDLTVVTDETGSFLFDSLLYGEGTQYVVMPTSQTAVFRYNNTSSGSAAVTLSKNHCEVTNLTFDNISSVRLSGRVLYANSTVPVRDANLMLNGRMVRTAGDALKTDASGNFQIRVPSGSAFTLQVVKDGHQFEGDGFIRINGDSNLTLSTALDGVRVWDQTKVRLAGRIVGGLDQAEKTLGFGLSRNNLGDNLRMVLELEGDNISYLVRVPSDLTKDTLEYEVPHVAYRADGSTDTNGRTLVHYQQKRIIVEPDPTTGEYCVDLFPVKYKVTQATATGYATLFGDGQTSSVVDMLEAAKQTDTIRNGADYVTLNERFNITYRTPVEVTANQMKYGLEMPYFGEQNMTSQNLLGDNVIVPLASLQADGSWQYLFGQPVFRTADYSFRVTAHEDYYFNNNSASDPDVVYLRGGKLKMQNGMRENTDIAYYDLDQNGQAIATATIDHVTYLQTGDSALHSLDFSVETDGSHISSATIRGYVLGARLRSQDLVASAIDTVQSNVTVLDVLRDPPGANSYAWLERGTKYKQKLHTTYNYQFGVTLKFIAGNNTQYFYGVFAGTGTGTMSGVLDVAQKTSEFTLPISVQFHGENTTEYEFTTRERIYTSSSPLHAGAMADVYIGTTSGMYISKADAFRVVDSASYRLLEGQIDNNIVRVVSQAVDADGKAWYLMRTEDNVVGQSINSSFAYTQQHILSTVIPDAVRYRNSLLLTGSREDAQALAESSGKYVFWSMVDAADSNFGAPGYYKALMAENYTGPVIDKVGAANKAIDQWLRIVMTNEKEKVSAYNDTPLSTVSISDGVRQEYEESYNYSNFNSSYVGYPFVSNQSGTQREGMGGFALSTIKNLYKVFNNADIVENLLNHSMQASQADRPSEFIRMEVGTTIFDFNFDPIMDFGSNLLPENGLTEDTSKTIGYVLEPGDYEHLSVNVYKAHVDTFNVRAQETRQTASDFDQDRADSYLYGSLIYRVMGGATRCPWEGPDSTLVYNPGTPMNLGTRKIENPQIVLDRHEVNNVDKDRAATFNIQMWNEVESDNGWAAGEIAEGIVFELALDESSNPYGARISIDGVPLSDGRSIRFYGSNIINKTVEVRAGTDHYDYDNVCLVLRSTCTPGTTYSKACFSVHYIPVSCEVNVATPHDNWIMNTLSPQDSVGYYLPVSIDGFDVNYIGFDHIELQYKLTTESDDGWVNLCSFYADDSLYQIASGTKVMIDGGRIDNIRFYGERDPMEQRYDLRAVSFCRHGSGFISRSSEVVSGVKDTRCPRVFGQPEPVYGILGVADNIKLRFNEPIAGNYLDEDNNFQLLGVTNSSGRISSSTSLYFDGTPTCGASSAVTRVLADKSFSIDLMAKPYSATIAEPMELFGHTTPTTGISFGLMPDGDSCRMFLYIGDHEVRSKAMEPLTDFRRMVVVVDRDENEVRFFAGTEELTDPASLTDTNLFSTLSNLHSQSAPLVFGHGFRGNMLEARVWVKAISQAEIVETHEHRLTGYERKLAAYYPMNEGRGNVCSDKASGSNLSLHGFAWTTPAGYALHLDGTQAVTLDQDILSRSAIQDYTLMFWFRTVEYNVPLFSAGWRQRGYQGADGFDGTLIAIENGRLRFRNGNMMQQASGSFADGAWHHYVLTVNRTQNNAAIYVDGNLVNTFSTDTLAGLGGDMMLGGAWNRPILSGGIDEMVLFEQALPKSLVEAYDNMAPYGDEMGLVAWLPFSEQVENSNGIMEEHFSINNRKIFRTTDGTVVEKIQPLVLSPSYDTLNTLFATDEDIAPVRERGLLTKMNFDWSFNQDELLINLNMQDREINKNNLFITVRNVEDLNGNRTVSPTMWQVYVNKNVLLWSENRLVGTFYETMVDDFVLTADISNISGRRHQYTIDGLPSWMTASQTYGSINPQEVIDIRFTIDHNLPVGIYSEIVYLTDEDGLSEPLKIMVEIKALCPWIDENPQQYDRQMILRGQVMVNGVYDSDPNDIVSAMVDGEIVGMANVSFNTETGSSHLYLVIHGTEVLESMPVVFHLWQASTGRIYTLSPSVAVTYSSDAAYGLPPAAPVLLSTTADEVQKLDIEPGWNWVSFYLKPGAIVSIGDPFYSPTPWSEGDQIKSVATQQFAEWDGMQWVGSLISLNHKHMYMIRTTESHYNTQFAGSRLTSTSDRTLTLHHGWNAFPYLQSSTANLRDAMADYIENVSMGDIIKSQNQFAIFSENERWEGSLTVLTPGQGYLLYRNGNDAVNFIFRGGSSFKGKSAPQGANMSQDKSSAILHLASATNMTLVCRVIGMAEPTVLKAYVAGQLVGAAEPTVVGKDTLFFLTIGTDQQGEVTFVAELDGEQKALASSQAIGAAANRHIGNISSPVLLGPNEQIAAYPVPFTDHVDFLLGDEGEATIRLFSTNGSLLRVYETNGARYTASDLKDLPAGVYFATVTKGSNQTTIKLIKK